MRKIYGLSVAVMMLLASCGTATQQMQILKPGMITLPSDIKRVGVVNRSLPGEGHGFGNFLEGLVSGESIAADREASGKCIRGLAAGLNEGPRLNAVVIEGVDLRGTGTRQWPVSLPWEQVSDICSRFNVDALIALETFDSDMALRESSADVERVINKEKVVVREYYAELLMNVRSGWTIYQPALQEIVDQDAFTDEMRWEESGDSPQKALGSLPSKRELLNESGFFSGTQYAARISPTWVNETRTYYRKANDEFKIAAKFVKQQKWTDAIGIWKRYTVDADPKVAGRACYNMALASEMDGNLVIALEWANRSWQSFGLKQGEFYAQLIEHRIFEQKKLEKQME
ncbi:MAG TPA: DUF6340 family protein [Lentimicrobium sp.]|nr:DUF6340 family protein [Lentimicrobium sp.]